MKEHMTQKEIKHLKRNGNIAVVFVWILGIITGILVKSMAK